MSIATPARKSQIINSKYLWIAPVLAALAYPLILMLLFRSGEFFRSATTVNNSIIGIAALLLSLLLTFSVPAIGFAIAYRLGQIEHPTPSQIQVRRFAHLVFACPPM